MKHEEANGERAWPHRQPGEGRIVSKQNASPVLDDSKADKGADRHTDRKVIS
jgi:hypothetical protein